MGVDLPLIWAIIILFGIMMYVVMDGFDLGIGFLMLFVGLGFVFLTWRKQLFEARWFHWITVATTPIGFVAIIAGWFTTEIGRQPWIVHGLMRTADAVSPHGVGQVGFTLALFVVVYFLVFGVGIYYILRLMRTVPSAVGATPSGPGGEQRAGAGAGTRGGHRPAAAGDDRQWSHGGRSGGPAPAPAE